MITKMINKKLKIVKRKLLSFGENYMETAVRNLLRKQGDIVGRHPWIFLIAPVVLIGIVSTGMFRMRGVSDVSILYTPSNARSHEERKIGEAFFDDEYGIYVMKMIVTAKDGGSLLRNNYIGDVLDLLDYFMKNYTIQYQNHSYTFGDVQINHKRENDLLRNFLLLYRSYHSSNVTTTNSAINFSFPVLDAKSEKFSLSACIGGITLNSTTGQLESVRQVFFRFRSSKMNQSYSDILYTWDKYFLKINEYLKHPKLDVTAASDRMVSLEMQRNGKLIMNYTALSFMVLIAFAVITSTTGDLVTSKPWEAFFGVVSTLLSVGCSYGIIFYIGYPFLSLLLVMPVLVLALGLDVTFIILRNWKTTNPELPVNQRLAETMAESGPSIVITSLTNIISAGVGAITTTPAVHEFCLSTAIAVTILFFVQITFFAAVIALGGRREHAKRNAFLLCGPVKQKANEKSSVESKAVETKPDESIALHVENKDWWYVVATYLAKFECTYICRAIVTVVMVVYWAVAIWGCTMLQLGITPEKFFLPDSPLNNFFKISNDGLHDALTLYVFVSKAPNFTNPIHKQRFSDLLDEFEQLPISFGPNATSVWTRPYVDYSAEWSEPGDSSFYQNVPSFLETKIGSRWKPYLTVKTDAQGKTTHVPKFMFSTSFKPAKSWNERTQFTVIWRNVIDKYQEFNISIWDDDDENYLADQLMAIPSTTTQDVGITCLCMGIICIMFIPNIFNTICAMLTIFSINLGVFGFLVHWGVSLDPISMATLLMSIGFSVDFTSHISFHYYSSEGTTQKEKLTSAIASIGFPMLQSGTSTVLSIACVCFVPSYLVWIFFKTVFLVVVFGILHGLIVLPTYLAWLPLNFWDFLYTNKRTASVKTHVSVKSASHENKPDIVCDLNTVTGGDVESCS